MKVLKLILFRPSNIILFLGIALLFFIDLILNGIVIPFAFTIDRIEKAIKYLLNLIKN